MLRLWNAIELVPWRAIGDRTRRRRAARTRARGAVFGGEGRREESFFFKLFCVIFFSKLFCVFFKLFCVIFFSSLRSTRASPLVFFTSSSSLPLLILRNHGPARPLRRQHRQQALVARQAQARRHPLAQKNAEALAGGAGRSELADASASGASRLRHSRRQGRRALAGAPVRHVHGLCRRGRGERERCCC